MTPEGKVKQQIKSFLADLGEDCRYYMPVLMGYGRNGIPDFDGGIYRGMPFTIETKAFNKSPKPWQVRETEAILRAGGAAFLFAKPFDPMVPQVLLLRRRNAPPIRWQTVSSFEGFVKLWNWYFNAL